MPNQPRLSSRLQSFAPQVLAVIFLLLAAATASGKVWRQEPAQQQQQQPAATQPSDAQQQPAATQPSDAQQQPAATQPSDAQQQPATTQPSDAQQQPAATQPSDAQQQPATTQPSDAQQQPAATQPADAQQQPAATQPADAQQQPAAQEAAPATEGQQPTTAPAAEGQQSTSNVSQAVPAKATTANKAPTANEKKADKKKGNKAADKKKDFTIVKINPLAGIKDLDGDSIKDAGPFTEAEAGEKSDLGKRTQVITEDELKTLLFKKELYLRGGYLNDNLNFNEHGGLIGKSPTGSFTLNYIEVTHITMGKHKITLECNRYGLHFMGNLDEDPDKNVEMIKLTPPKKKRPLIINIDREVVVKVPKPKVLKVPVSKAAAKKNQPGTPATAAGTPPQTGNPATPSANPATAEAAGGEAQQPANGQTADNGEQKPADQNTAAASSEGENKPAESTAENAPKPEEKVAKAPTESELENMTEEEQVKASIASSKPEERPSDPNSVTHTYSPVHASRVLRQALDNIFAVGQDSRFLNAMPDFWKHYYEAQDSRSFYRFKVPGMVRISDVDTRPALLKAIEPGSNQYAQDNDIVGIARYRALVGADGKVQDVAITVPIGFGLDERAVDSIKKAEFKPAMKGGHPVMTSVDLYITFRIFSKMTTQSTQKKDAEPPDASENKVQVTPPTRPGPFTLLHPYDKNSVQQELNQQAAPNAPTGSVQPATGQQQPAGSETPKN